MEGAALSERALHRYFSAHQLHQLPGDGQTETRAAKLGVALSRRLLESTEDLVLLVLGDAHTRVLHRGDQIDAASLLVLDPGRHRNSAFVGELHRIADQVDHHLTQPRLVQDQRPGNLGVYLDGKGDVLLRHLSGKPRILRQPWLRLAV